MDDASPDNYFLDVTSSLLTIYMFSTSLSFLVCICGIPLHLAYFIVMYPCFSLTTILVMLMYNFFFILNKIVVYLLLFNKRFIFNNISPIVKVLLEMQILSSNPVRHNSSNITPPMSAGVQSKFHVIR